MDKKALLAIYFIIIAVVLFNIYKPEVIQKQLRLEHQQYVDIEQSIKQSADRKKVNDEKLKKISTDEDRKPFFKAIIACNLTELEELLAKGEVLDQVDQNGNTALVWASRQGCVELAQFLIAKGVDVNQKSSNGFTPLMWASMSNRKDLMELLIKAGSEPLPEYWNKKSLK